MKLNASKQRLKVLIEDTVTLLCKNGVDYDQEFSVEGIVVITVDKQDTFHASIRETFNKESKLEITKNLGSASNTSQAKPPLRKRRADSEIDTITENSNRKKTEKFEDTVCKGNSDEAKKTKRAPESKKDYSTKAEIKVEPKDKTPPVARRQMRSSTPIVVIEPLPVAISTRSARKLAEESAKIGTRSSTKHTPPTKGKFSDLKRRSASEPKVAQQQGASSKKISDVGENITKTSTRGQRDAIGPSAKETPQVKSTSGPQTPVNTFTKLKTQSAEKPSKDAKAAAKAGADTTKDVESVLIDTRGSVILGTAYENSTATYKSGKGRWPKPPIVNTSPEYRRITIPTTARQSLTDYNEQSDRPMVVNVPTLVVGGTLANQRDRLRLEGASSGSLSINIGESANGDVYNESTRKIHAGELSPSTLNEVVQKALSHYNPLKMKHTITTESNIKINVGLGGPRSTFSNPLECPTCKLIFGSLEERRAHSSCSPMPEGTSRLFRCDVCQAVFMKTDNLRKHYTTHHS